MNRLALGAGGYPADLEGVIAMVEQSRRVLVTGAGGFIGHHLTSFLKEQGYWVRGADLKNPEFEASKASGGTDEVTCAPSVHRRSPGGQLMHGHRG